MTRELGELEHVRIRFKNHGVSAQAIILNTGALIGPEAGAMMQALHSRSIGGFDHHFQEVAKRGAEKFMQQTYVGYGHKSIGDCGSVTVFIEGVSMLCAKAIQDSRLYNGQEASTRYIDFSKQPFIDPIGGNATQILEDLRALYLETRAQLTPHLTRQFPRPPGEDEKKYEKAINARSFDIARSLLPAGASTNLAWHGTIRSIGDHLMLLRHHPLLEVRRVAKAIRYALIGAYPSSFRSKRYRETEEYNALIMKACYFFDAGIKEFALRHDGIDRSMLEDYKLFLPNRPAQTELPRKIEECGMLTYEYPLDFGSFRDVQRHRAVIQQMPLLTTRLGFEPWYLAQLPEAAALQLTRKLLRIEKQIDRLPFSHQDRQYYVPMGYLLPNRISGGLHAQTYLAERRARTDVHPTLQVRAHQIADDLRERFAEFGMVVHTEESQGLFSMKRGSQDIVMSA